MRIKCNELIPKLFQQVDIRDIVTGESLFKLTLNQMVNTVMQADYRGRGANDLVICMRNGDGK